MQEETGDWLILDRPPHYVEDRGIAVAEDKNAKKGPSLTLPKPRTAQLVSTIRELASPSDDGYATNSLARTARQPKRMTLPSPRMRLYTLELLGRREEVIMERIYR